MIVYEPRADYALPFVVYTLFVFALGCAIGYFVLGSGTVP